MKSSMKCSASLYGILLKTGENLIIERVPPKRKGSCMELKAPDRGGTRLQYGKTPCQESSKGRNQLKQKQSLQSRKPPVHGKPGEHSSK